MTLPPNFQFNQSNLQDFTDCQRRFQLRNILERAWPGVESEPLLESERYLELGKRFHCLVQQHVLGVPVEKLSSLIQDYDLEIWWGNYLKYTASLTGGEDGKDLRLYPEITLSAPLKGCGLIAKYDLIMIKPEGKVTIIDWKTSRNHPGRQWLTGRLQTRLYPYLLSRAGDHLVGGKKILPQDIEMIYWFANFPEQPERFSYDANCYEADEEYLMGLLQSIQNLKEDEFDLTGEIERCAYCVYRSLCNRGVKAGLLSDKEGDLGEGSYFELEFDFEQIVEIEF